MASLSDVCRMGVSQLVITTTLLVLAGAQVSSEGPSSLVVAERSSSVPGTADAATRRRAIEAMAGVPLHFEANVGQADSAIDYLARGHGYRVALGAAGATLTLGDDPKALETMHLRLRDANPAAVAAPLDQLPGRVSYYRRNAPARWAVNASTHGRVAYRDVYDGIDIVYYGNQRKLQYDFLVDAGADPSRIAIEVVGADRVSLTATGALRLEVGQRVIEQAAPVSWQVIDGQRRPVDSRFVVDGRLVRFALGAYDSRHRLVIDPVITYSSWFGGSGEEGFLELATAPDGSLVTYGYSYDLQSAALFPTTPGAIKPTRGADSDLFVARFDATGAVLLFSTFIGGSGEDGVLPFGPLGGTGLAVDATGNIHLAGNTRSADFPTTAGAFDADYNGDDPGAVAGSNDVCYVKLSPTGALLYSTYYGGRAADEPYGLDVDAAGNAYITGRTVSSQSTVSPGTGFFPIVGNAMDGTFATMDVFLARFTNTGVLDYSSYIGGSGYDGFNGADIKLSRQAANVVYIATDTDSATFPTTGTRYQTYAAGYDAVLIRVDMSLAPASQITYGTFFGGSGDDSFKAMAIDADDRVYVTGTTTSSAAFAGAPTWAGSPAPSGTDVLIAKFDPSASGAASRVYGMRLNGTYTDTGTGIVVDSQRQAWIGVGSSSFSAVPAATDFPLKNSITTTRSGNGVHQAVVQLNAAGSDVVMSTLIGGNAGSGGQVSLAVTGADSIWVGASNSGGTSSMPLVAAYQPTYGGGDADATLQRIGFSADLSLTKTASPALPTTVLPGQALTYTIVVNNLSGDAASNVTVADSLPAQVVFVSCAATGGGVCGGTGAARTITFPTLPAGSSATITIATTVAADVAPGATWTNTATVTSTTTDPVSGNNAGGVGAGAPVLADPTADADGDGLPNGFEQQYGLNGLNDSAGNGANGDPDGDGKTNLQELAEGTHPRGFVITYLAEGATGAFFDTRLALANPTNTQALVLTRFQKGDGSTVRQYTVIPPFSRATLDVETLAGLESAEFSTLVEADVQVVADRTMTWDGGGYGSHAERGILTRTATKWYFAEGATFGPFNLFYLIQNPNAQAANVTVTYLLPTGTPLTKQYTVGPQSRFNIWVDSEGVSDPALAPLANAELSAIIESTNGVPIIAERAMYLDQPGRALGAGHESAGVTAPSTQWFLAEGATGSYFDLFILIANPQATPAAVQAEFLLASGQVITKQYTVIGNSRFNIWVDLEDAALADAAVSTRVTSTNGVPIIVERAMWWPGPESNTWQEAHNSPGEVTTGTRWAMAEGEVGGARDAETYVLIANTSPVAGTARVTVLFEDGTTAITRDFPLNANSRSNVTPAADFPETIGKRFGLLVESVGATPAQIVVERAMYSDSGGVNWAAGTNALATKLQ